MNRTDFLAVVLALTLVAASQHAGVACDHPLATGQGRVLQEERLAKDINASPLETTTRLRAAEREPQASPTDLCSSTYCRGRHDVQHHVSNYDDDDEVPVHSAGAATTSVER